MKVGRLHIGTWEWAPTAKKRFIFFERLYPGCGCKIITIFNICFDWIGKECE